MGLRSELYECHSKTLTLLFLVHVLTNLTVFWGFSWKTHMSPSFFWSNSFVLAEWLFSPFKAPFTVENVCGKNHSYQLQPHHHNICCFCFGVDIHTLHVCLRNTEPMSLLSDMLAGRFHDVYTGGSFIFFFAASEVPKWCQSVTPAVLSLAERQEHKGSRRALLPTGALHAYQYLCL